MAEGWAYDGSPAPLPGGSVTLVEGVTFCISGPEGDISRGGQQGLFFRDTRFLDRFELEVDGFAVDPLAVRRLTPYAAEFVGRRPPRVGQADSTLLVVRRRYVGNGMLEQIAIRNLGREAAGVILTLLIDADFAGLFEVKEDRVRLKEGIERAAEGGAARLHYEGATESRGVALIATADPVVSSGQIVWHAVVRPRQEWRAEVEVISIIDGAEAPRRHRIGVPAERSQPATELAAWRRLAPAVSTPDGSLMGTLATSAEDLGSLRVQDPASPERTIVAAGVPWFMTLFGRDSLLTSWMLLPLDASLALGTLRTLARLQGTRVDTMSEEEPGRILHEVRAGLDAEAALGGQSVYYGSVDATPLFVMLLGELRRWGLAREEVDALLPHADRALAWVERFGDRDGDGFVEYKRATDRGLVNQGWKDSFDAISYVSGALAEPPIALAEVQGYVYAAYLARSHFAREVGDVETAGEWAARADALKRRFNEAFWLPEREHYALALDRDKRPVDSLASNMGHCLWTGIVDEANAPAVARHLTGPDMFSGFGVRTLASSMGGYNPMSYHNGSVWPHDSTIVAAGLMRYGFVAEAQRVAVAVLDAAQTFQGRLPELFCGFDRSEFSVPIPYPTSCSPQAWAAASPLYLLRTLLRFDPWIPFGRVWCDPALPARFLPLQVRGIHVAGTEVSLTVRQDGWALEGLPEDITVLPRPRSPLTAAAPRRRPARPPATTPGRLAEGERLP